MKATERRWDIGCGCLSVAVAVTTSRHPPLYLLALPTLSQRLVLGNDERFVGQLLAPTASDYSLPVQLFVA